MAQETPKGQPTKHTSGKEPTYHVRVAKPDPAPKFGNGYQGAPGSDRREQEKRGNR